MDVHHHSHTERKTFKHYLFEFFMLFLAVFSGFAAEYFLEQLIEHHHEKEFIESMMLDLKDDTAKIVKVYNFSETQTQGVDTLIHILFHDPGNKDSIQKAYRLYYSYSLNYDNVVFTDRTVTQLKNSGGLRLIRNKGASDSIMNYDAGVKACDLQFDVVKRAWENESNASFGVFDLQRLYNLPSRSSPMPTALFNAAPAAVNGYTSRLLIFNQVVKSYTVLIRNQKAAAIRLMAYLTKEYGLQNE